MVAINFTTGYDGLMNATKRQTIRLYNPKRYEQIKRLKKLQIFWKQRTPECKKLFDAHLVDIMPFKFKDVPIEWRDSFAIADGFEDWEKLEEWFLNTYDEETFLNADFMRIGFRAYLENEPQVEVCIMCLGITAEPGANKVCPHCNKLLEWLRNRGR